MSPKTVTFDNKVWLTDDLWNLIQQSSLQSLAVQALPLRDIGRAPKPSLRDFHTERDIFELLLRIHYYPKQSVTYKLLHIVMNIVMFEIEDPDYSQLNRVDKLTVDYLVNFYDNKKKIICKKITHNIY